MQDNYIKNNISLLNQLTDMLLDFTTYLFCNFFINTIVNAVLLLVIKLNVILLTTVSQVIH